MFTKIILLTAFTFLPITSFCASSNTLSKHTLPTTQKNSKFKTNMAQASKWFDEQPLIVQIPVGIGALVLAAATASGILYTAAYTAGFIPSFIFHPFNTVEQICNGDPRKILGAVGTAALAAALAYKYPQYQQYIPLAK